MMKVLQWYDQFPEDTLQTSRQFEMVGALMAEDTLVSLVDIYALGNGKKLLCLCQRVGTLIQ